MHIKIQWSKEALTDLRILLAYCRVKFSKKVAKECKDKLIEKMNILATFPYAGIREPLLADEPEEFRSLVLHPHTKLIYYVDEKKEIIYIFRLWDTRRNPLNIKKKLQSDS